MKKIVLLTALVAIVLVSYSLTQAEDTLPPLPIPVLDESATPEPSVVAQVEASPSPSPSPSPVVVRSVVVQDFTNDADTGSKLYVLLAVSALGGFGLFCIKKYFDSKRYSI